MTTEWEGDDDGASNPEGSKPVAGMACALATISGEDEDGNAASVDQTVCLTEMFCAGGDWTDTDGTKVTVAAGACGGDEGGSEAPDDTDGGDTDDEASGDDDAEDEEGDGEEEEDLCADIEDADAKALCDKWNGEDCEAEALSEDEKTECTENQVSGAKALAAGAMALAAIAALM